MSDAAAFPRDDRAWPPGAFTVSLAVVFASLAGSAALVASADSWWSAVGLAVVFTVLAAVQTAAYVDALLPWLQGASVPGRTYALQPAIALGALLTFAGGGAMGACGLLGYLAGVFLPNAWASRRARVNRDLVDAGEARLAREREQQQADEWTAAHPASPWDIHAPRPSSRRAPKVGQVLGDSLAETRERCLAWAAATVVVLVGSVALGGSRPLFLALAFLGLAALAWVCRQLLGVWLALRDFEAAATEPRRAYVVLLRDPNPRLTRPLLCVWSSEPLPTGGRLPPAETVYRCDESRDALLSVQGGAVVHEAWLDTGARARSRPHWVAADAGIALPHRRSFLGSFYVASVIGSERPGRARPLTMPAPDPTRENATGTIATVISEESPGTGHWARLFAWRLAGLTLVDAVSAWIGRAG